MANVLYSRAANVHQNDCSNFAQTISFLKYSFYFVISFHPLCE
jgi:hypothetical protein